MELTARLTEARALQRSGELAIAEERYTIAAEIARAGRSAARLREVLGEWAALRAAQGDHRGAYVLSSEALSVK